MSKPNYVYMVTTKESGWIPCYYDVYNAMDKATEIAVHKGYKKEDLYFDSDGEAEHLFVKGIPDEDDPDLGDLEVVTIISYEIEDAWENK